VCSIARFHLAIYLQGFLRFLNSIAWRHRPHVSFHRDPRVTILAAIAGLFIAYDRQVLQYHRYWWDSVFDFVISWFVHYIAVILVVGIAYAITRSGASFLRSRSETFRDLTLEEVMVYGFIVVIVAAAAAFFIAHVVPFEME
jgi:ABC-type enterochelin transport system permease subunit